MLIEVSGCVVNAYAEPQFKGMSSDQIITVEFAEWESLTWFRKKLGGEILFNQKAKYFAFTGYIQLEKLQSFVKGRSLKIEELWVEENTSPRPVAFEFDGLTYDKEDENGEIICDGANEWGYCYPEDLMMIWQDSDAHYEQFHSYPLFVLPDILKDRNALWDQDIDGMTASEFQEKWEQVSTKIKSGD